MPLASHFPFTGFLPAQECLRSLNGIPENAFLKNRQVLSGNRQVLSGIQ
jgi:hypothetical protein